MTPCFVRTHEGTALVKISFHMITRIAAVVSVSSEQRLEQRLQTQRERSGRTSSGQQMRIHIDNFWHFIHKNAASGSIKGFDVAYDARGARPACARLSTSESYSARVGAVQPHPAFGGGAASRNPRRNTPLRMSVGRGAPRAVQRHKDLPVESVPGSL